MLTSRGKAMKLARVTDQKFQAALQKLLKESLPLRTAFKLKGIAKRAQEELDKYEEVRKAAVERYGSKDENGNLIVLEEGTVKLEGENLNQFVKELSDLVNTEISIGTVSIDELGDKVNMSAEELLALEDLLV